MNLKKLNFLLLFYFLFSTPCALQHVFDTPLALTGDKGAIEFNSIFNDRGSTKINLNVSINTFLELGLLLQAEQLIGKSDIHFHLPNVQLKIRFTDHTPESWNIAFGYDLHQHGSLIENPNSTLLTTTPWNSLYMVYTKGFFLLASLPHLVSFGFKVPIYPVESALHNLTIFSSFVLRINSFLYFAFELDNFKFFAKEYRYYFNENNIVSLQLAENLELMLIWQIALAKVDESNAWINSRSIKIVYQTFF